jgi:hypothetical protein
MLGQVDVLAQDLGLDWYSLSSTKKKYCRQCLPMEDIKFLSKSITLPINPYMESSTFQNMKVDKFLAESK